LPKCSYSSSSVGLVTTESHRVGSEVLRVLVPPIRSAATRASDEREYVLLVGTRVPSGHFDADPLVPLVGGRLWFRSLALGSKKSERKSGCGVASVAARPALLLEYLDQLLSSRVVWSLSSVLLDKCELFKN